MDIGKRLKQVRLEKGLSQRQLCGEVITRNMLSLIENGSAKPSMDTLRYLAARLETPMGYFLEEGVSPDTAVMEDARKAYEKQDYRQVLECLERRVKPSEEGTLLQVLSLLALAQEAVNAGKLPYAQSLLEQMQAVGEKCLYYTPELEKRRLLLCCRAYEDAAPFAALLPDLTEELLVRAKAAEPERRLALLAAVDCPEGQLLKAQVYLDKKQFSEAAACFQKAEAQFPKQAAQGLEHCYRELKDFEKAYFYACKNREVE